MRVVKLTKKVNYARGKKVNYACGKANITRVQYYSSQMISKRDNEDMKHTSKHFQGNQSN